MNGTDVQSTLRDMWETRPARPREGAQIAGVAAAIGRRYSVDPVLVRVGFVVTAFYGIGALLYLAGWVLLPDERAERARGRPRTLLLVGLTIATIIGLGALFGSRGGWVLPTLGALGLLFLLHRNRAGLPAATPAPAAEAPTQPTAAGPPGADAAVRPPAWDPLGAAPFAWDLPEPAPAAPPPPAPRRAPVTAVTLAAALIAGGGMGIALLAGGGPADLPLLFGVVLAVLGTGLVVGSFLRAGRGLVPVALLMGALTWGVVATPWERFEGDAGEFRVAPTSAAAVEPRYEQQAGTFELDLRGVDLAVPAGTPAAPVRSDISIGAGDIQVWVPRNADVTLRAEAGLGRAAFEGRESSGPGSTITVIDDLGADGVASGRPIELVVEAGVGNVEVRRG